MALRPAQFCFRGIYQSLGAHLTPGFRDERKRGWLLLPQFYPTFSTSLISEKSKKTKATPSFF